MLGVELSQEPPRAPISPGCPIALGFSSTQVLSEIPCHRSTGWALLVFSLAWQLWGEGGDAVPRPGSRSRALGMLPSPLQVKKGAIHGWHSAAIQDGEDAVTEQPPAFQELGWFECGAHAVGGASAELGELPACYGIGKARRSHLVHPRARPLRESPQRKPHGCVRAHRALSCNVGVLEPGLWDPASGEGPRA